MLDRTLLSQLSVDYSSADRQLLSTYIGEAEFYFSLLRSDFDSAKGSLLEVGSGVGLLALYAASLGRKVWAFEPETSGFGKMASMNSLLRRAWQGNVGDVQWVNDRLTESDPHLSSKATYAFAIHVIEHAPIDGELFGSVLSNLEVGGKFRFICPNYVVPYEPHFDMPTLWSKRLTKRVMRRRINSSPVTDAWQMWEELSWPTVTKLKRLFKKLGFHATFSSQATHAFLTRPFQDKSFIDRKGPLAGNFLRFGSLALEPVISRTPVALLPLIDCTLTRKSDLHI